MKFNLLNIFKKAPLKRTIIKMPRSNLKRGFASAKVDDLTASFTGSQLSINQELRMGLRQMRSRSRQLFMDNDYAKRFGGMVKKNVVGVKGIVLQARSQDAKGNLDELDNNQIEKAWRSWCKPKHCTTSGNLSFIDVCAMVEVSMARDGEVLVQMIDTPRSPFGFMLRVLSADYLDEQHNENLSNGHRITMGVETDADGLTVAYHLRDDDPAVYANSYRPSKYKRVDAANIRHIFISDWPEQKRGLPWMHTAIRRLNMLGGYEEAELVAARIGASKMGFYTSADGDGFTAADVVADGENGKDGDDGELIDEAMPGQFQQLPNGVGFEAFDPQHPTSAFADFSKAILRGAASGLEVAYNSLANDLEGVNFSSIRAGVLEERDHWKSLQAHLIQHLCEPVYERFLRAGLLNQKIPLPFKKFDKYTAVHWQPRGFAWIDPLKDAKANKENIDIGLSTRSKALAAEGEDFKDTIEQLAYEQKIAKQHGVDISTNESIIDLNEVAENAE